MIYFYTKQATVWHTVDETTHTWMYEQRRLLDIQKMNLLYQGRVIQ